MTDSAEKDAPRLGLRARISRAWNRCNYCGHDRRSPACCGIVYLPDRMDEPPERPHSGRRCDCDRCWTTLVIPPGSTE